MDEDPKIKELGIQPDAVTFKTLLKCITKLRGFNAGQLAERLLNKMEKRRVAGNHSIAVDRGAFVLAIRACIRSKDLKRAEKLVERIPGGPRRFDYELLVRAWRRKRSTKESESQIGRLEELMKKQFTPACETPKATW
jgi:hypothetical protein